MNIHQLNPESATLFLRWRKGTWKCVPIRLNPDTFEPVDYDADTEALRSTPSEDGREDWLIEAFEDMNLCVEESVKRADFKRNTVWGRRGKFYEARLVTIYCSHCGGKIDIDVRAVRGNNKEHQ